MCTLASQTRLCGYNDVRLLLHLLYPPFCVVSLLPANVLQMVAALREDPERASRIVGLIDHHAIAESYSTKGPTFMDVRPWGSMASIVAHSYIRDGRTLEVPYARILLCAILSDTLALRSPTTTPADRLIVSLLSVMGDVEEPLELAKRMFRAKTNWYE